MRQLFVIFLLALILLTSCSSQKNNNESINFDFKKVSKEGIVDKILPENPEVQDSKGIIFELSPEGEVVWENRFFVNPTSYYKDRSGNRYVSDYKTGKFFKISPENYYREVSEGNNPNFIEKTADNTLLLVNESGQHSVYEIDKEGNVLWLYENVSHPNSAHKLENGDYLVAIKGDNAIQEVDKDLNVVWQSDKDSLKSPTTVQVLKNGNYLIADFDQHRIVELNDKSEKVWEYSEDLNHPIAAVKLDNNEYVISDFDRARILFVSPEGKVIKEIKGYKAFSLSILPDGNIGVAGQKV